MTSQSLPLVAALLLASGGALAQSAGSLVVYGGAAQTDLRADSGELPPPSLPGSRIDLKKASTFAGGVTYYWTDRISIDIPVVAPYRHDILAAGALAGVGKLGSVQYVPVTLTAQYRFGDADSALRPFVGAGVTYGHFSKAKATAALTGVTGGTPANPTTLTLKRKLGTTVELGASYNVTKDWSASLSVGKTFIKTDARLSTGQNFETSLDPVSIRFGIGYRF